MRPLLLLFLDYCQKGLQRRGEERGRSRKSNKSAEQGGIEGPRRWINEGRCCICLFVTDEGGEFLLAGSGGFISKRITYNSIASFRLSFCATSAYGRQRTFSRRCRAQCLNPLTFREGGGGDECRFFRRTNHLPIGISNIHLHASMELTQLWKFGLRQGLSSLSLASTQAGLRQRERWCGRTLAAA